MPVQTLFNLINDDREKDSNMALYEARQKHLRKTLNRKCGDMRRGKEEEKALETALDAARLHSSNLSAEEEQLQAAVNDVKKRKVCCLLTPIFWEESCAKMTCPCVVLRML